VNRFVPVQSPPPSATFDDYIQTLDAWEIDLLYHTQMSVDPFSVCDALAHGFCAVAKRRISTAKFPRIFRLGSLHVQWRTSCHVHGSRSRTASDLFSSQRLWLAFIPLIHAQEGGQVYLYARPKDWHDCDTQQKPSPNIKRHRSLTAFPQL
jgi:hypothetical protein